MGMYNKIIRSIRKEKNASSARRNSFNMFLRVGAKIVFYKKTKYYEAVFVSFGSSSNPVLWLQ